MRILMRKLNLCLIKNCCQHRFTAYNGHCDENDYFRHQLLKRQSRQIRVSTTTTRDKRGRQNFSRDPKLY